MEAQSKSKDAGKDVGWRWPDGYKLDTSISHLFFIVEKKYRDIPILLEEIRDQVINDGSAGKNSASFLRMLAEDWMSDTLHAIKAEEKLAIKAMLFIVYDVEINGNDLALGKKDAQIVGSDWFVGTIMDGKNAQEKLHRLDTLLNVLSCRRNEVDVSTYATLLRNFTKP